MYWIFKNQLTGAPEPENADKIIKWNTNSESFEVSFKVSDTGDTALDGRWFLESKYPDWTRSQMTLNTGDVFEIINNQNEQEIFISVGKS